MTRRRLDPAGLVAAAGLFALAVLIVVDMERMQIAPFYGIGPKAMPYAIAAGLALLGLGNLALAFTGGFPERDSMDLKRVALILGGVVGMIGIVAFGFGFIAASMVLFAAVARAFEEKPVPPLAGIGLMALIGLLIVALVLSLAGVAFAGILIRVLVLASIAVIGSTLLSFDGARNLAIGLALGVVAYLLFAKLLALTLPVGPLERLL